MTQTAQEALRGAKLHSDGSEYTIVGLPANAITLAAGIVAEAGLAFSAMIVDKDEVTLLLPGEICQDFANRLQLAESNASAYRLITFDAVLNPDLVGFMALISSALAAAGIPILTLAAYSRDHILVPADDFDRAMQELGKLKDQLT